MIPYKEWEAIDPATLLPKVIVLDPDFTNYAMINTTTLVNDDTI